MKNAALEKWTPLALGVEQPLEKLPVPVHVLSGEAVDIARFFERHYAAQRDAAGKVVRPGLELAAREGQLTPQLGSEILELQDASRLPTPNTCSRSPKSRSRPCGVPSSCSAS